MMRVAFVIAAPSLALLALLLLAGLARVANT